MMLDILGYLPKDWEIRKILHDLKVKSRHSIMLDEFFNLLASMGPENYASSPFSIGKKSGPLVCLSVAKSKNLTSFGHSNYM
nr:unnamed protein product [Callosobruchus chinensis]